MIIPSILLVQTVAEVEPEVETAAVNNQTTVPKVYILEEVSVPVHIGGQTVDPHYCSIMSIKKTKNRLAAISDKRLQCVKFNEST